MKKGLEHLLGFELYREGMDAIHNGNFDTAPAQLLLMARSRLKAAGLHLTEHKQSISPHFYFYRLLAEKYPDAHYKFNAYRQRLLKFCRAVENL